MRQIAFGMAVAASVGCAGAVRAEACGPEALGTHRTLKISAADGPVGVFNYKKSLDLNDREVVLTFDDGPMPKRTPAVLEALGRECVKATFFVVGSMVANSPDILRETARAGHTIGTHTWSHRYLNRTRTQKTREEQIAGGLHAASIVLGGENRAQLSPLFRFPGLGRSKALDRFVETNGLISMSVDVVSDDWRKISPDEVLKRSLARLEARGKGILLLHDIQPRTVAMLPELLKELKARGFRIVHVTTDARETEVALANLSEPQNKSFQIVMARTRQKLDVLTAQAKAGPGDSFVPERRNVKVAVRGFEELGLRGLR